MPDALPLDFRIEGKVTDAARRHPTTMACRDRSSSPDHRRQIPCEDSRASFAASLPPHVPGAGPTVRSIPVPPTMSTAICLREPEMEPLDPAPCRQATLAPGKSLISHCRSHRSRYSGSAAGRQCCARTGNSKSQRGQHGTILVECTVEIDSVLAAVAA